MNNHESVQLPQELSQDELTAVMQDGFTLDSLPHNPQSGDPVSYGERWELRDAPGQKQFVRQAITYLERGGELTDRQKESLYWGVTDMRIQESESAERYGLRMPENIQELSVMLDSLNDFSRSEKPAVPMQTAEPTNLLHLPRPENARKLAVSRVLGKFIRGTIYYMGKSPGKGSHWF